MNENNQITYTEKVDNLTIYRLQGFFVGWKNPPSAKTHLKLLKQSDYVILAIDKQIGNVVGFITAVSDKVLSAYIPLLEVLPHYQKRGIGKELFKRMLARLKNYYMVDLVCDPGLNPYYAKLGFQQYNAMIIRNYENQNGG